MLAVVFVAGLIAAGARTASASCGSDSDCAGVGKCSSGKCGACGSDSDCNGHGKCSSGKCGACGSDSDCKFGTCSSGRCGSCGSDSDCKVGKCSSGKCGSCGSDSDCKGGRCSSGRCSNALSAGLDWLAPAEDAEAAGCGAPGADVFRIATTVPDARSCRRTAPAGGEAMSFTPVSGPSSSRASARPIRHAMP